MFANFLLVNIIYIESHFLVKVFKNSQPTKNIHKKNALLKITSFIVYEKNQNLGKKSKQSTGSIFSCDERKDGLWAALLIPLSSLLGLKIA